MEYIVYDGESRDVRFEGECTNTLKDGILARQTGSDAWWSSVDEVLVRFTQSY